MRAVDTNVLIRLVTRDDTSQVAEAEAFVRKGAWVSHLVLVEAFWVLTSVYELGRDEVATVVEMLLDHEDLTVEAPDIVACAVATFRERTGVGFSDCLILEVAKRAGHVPLGTFDRDLGRLEGAQRISPGHPK
jgi:predicted nucleic-acid-binding protein